MKKRDSGSNDQPGEREQILCCCVDQISPYWGKALKATSFPSAPNFPSLFLFF